MLSPFAPPRGNHPIIRLTFADLPELFPAYKKLAEGFESNHPGVHVNLDHRGDSSYIQEVELKASPDVFFVNRLVLPWLVQNRHISPPGRSL